MDVPSQTYEQTPSATQKVALVPPRFASTAASTVATAPAAVAATTGVRRPGNSRSVMKASSAAPAAQYAGSSATWSIIADRPVAAPAPATVR